MRALVARVEMVLRQEEERRAQQALVLAKVEAVRKELEPLERVRFYESVDKCAVD